MLIPAIVPTNPIVIIKDIAFLYFSGVASITEPIAVPTKSLFVKTEMAPPLSAEAVPIPIFASPSTEPHERSPIIAIFAVIFVSLLPKPFQPSFVFQLCSVSFSPHFSHLFSPLLMPAFILGLSGPFSISFFSFFSDSNVTNSFASCSLPSDKSFCTSSIFVF